MRFEKPILISVIGVGHMGRLHAAKVVENEDAELVGVYDIDREKCLEAAEQFETRAFETLDEAIGYSQAVILATPTKTHGTIGTHVLMRARHLLVEKPIAGSVDEAEILVSMAKERDVILWVGHIENFNPAWVAAKEFIEKPLFLEIHRISGFTSRSTDISVVEDLMIHDLELLARICGDKLKNVHASMTNVLTDKPDIANARLHFKSGCIANVTASRISKKSMRKLRVFQKNAYISVDFKDRRVEIYRLPKNGKISGEIAKFGEAEIEILRPPVPQLDPLTEQLKFFIDCIKSDTKPDCTPAVQALRWAKTITKEATR